MKKAILLTIATGLLAGSVLAANGQPQEGEAMAPGMMMGMMNHEQMMTMHEHMQEMQQLMADIREENDPDRRMQMMQEHMVQMNEAMSMMGGAMMGSTGDGNMANLSMEERMQMMQNQMGMMNMMMEQMMNHFSHDGSLHE